MTWNAPPPAAGADSAQPVTPSPVLEMAVGDDVVHATFGDGVVTGVEPDGIVVRFASDGSERKLMADYAPVRRR
jgi:DNA helicase-2/ATP-dependent DNA helicase PcrA